MSDTLVEARNISFIPPTKWRLKTEYQGELSGDREARLSETTPVTHVRIAGIETKRAMILEKELKKTLLNLSLAGNFVILSLSLLTFTKYAAPLVLVAVALFFRRLAHMTTIQIFLRRERNAPTG